MVSLVWVVVRLDLTCRCLIWLSLVPSLLCRPVSLVSPGLPPTDVTVLRALATACRVLVTLTCLYDAQVSRPVSLSLWRRPLDRAPVVAQLALVRSSVPWVVLIRVVSVPRQALPMNLTIRVWLPALRRLCVLDPTRLLVRIRWPAWLALLTVAMYRVLNCLVRARECS